MDWRAVCAVVIPCLNEEAAIGAVVTGVRAHLPNVLVVDDGSTDGTTACAQKAGAVVLRHAVSQGKGAALQTGWSETLRRGFAWSLSMDGDGQHAPEDIPGLLNCAEQTSAALVVGDRMAQAARIPPVRRWVNRFMSWRLSEITGVRLPDSQCGFRLMNLREWSRLRILAAHFEVESEVLFQFANAGLPIRFTPVQAIYKSEHSKIHPLRDTVRWLSWQWRAGRAGSFLRSHPQALGSEK